MTMSSRLLAGATRLAWLATQGPIASQSVADGPQVVPSSHLCWSVPVPSTQTTSRRLAPRDATDGAVMKRSGKLPSPVQPGDDGAQLAPSQLLYPSEPSGCTAHSWIVFDPHDVAAGTLATGPNVS